MTTFTIAKKLDLPSDKVRTCIRREDSR